MKESRKIIHIDMDAFFAAVEERDHPEYRGKPLVVGGMPDSRGVVATCNYEARKFGIRSAMPSSWAYRLCPEATFLRPRFDAYRQASAEIRAIFYDYTDLVEPLSLDEAYLDVSRSTACRGSATLIAEEIRRRIFEETQLTASAGVSYNKLLAKIASDVNKPNGLFIITPEHGPRFVETLPVSRFHGIGKATESKMQRMGIQTGRDLRSRSKEFLRHNFGKAGSHYYDIARGEDHRPVVAQRPTRSLGAEVTLPQDISDYSQIVTHLRRLLTKVASKLEKKKLAAHTVTIKVKYPDFKLVTRSRTINKPVFDLDQNTYIIEELLAKTEAGKRPVRLLGVSVSSLIESSQIDEPKQTDLFDDTLKP